MYKIGKVIKAALFQFDKGETLKKCQKKTIIYFTPFQLSRTSASV